GGAAARPPPPGRSSPPAPRVWGSGRARRRPGSATAGSDRTRCATSGCPMPTVAWAWCRSRSPPLRYDLTLLLRGTSGQGRRSPAFEEEPPFGAGHGPVRPVDRVGVDRDRCDALAHEELRELRAVRRRLPAQRR